MKKVLLTSLVILSFSSAFAGTVEAEVARPAKMNCKLELTKMDHADGDDNTRTEEVFSREINALDASRDARMQLSMSDQNSYRVVLLVAKSEGNKLQTSLALEDLITGVSASSETTSVASSQELGEIKASIYSTQKIAIFGDSINVKLNFTCK